MNLSVVWLHAAAEELKDAVSRYSEINPDLGRRFADAVDHTLTDIRSGPLHFADFGKGRRRAGVSRFPYGLFYLVESDRIVVIACFHGKRNPHGWRERVI